MERLPYSGTWVTCGAYAFLNGSGLPMKYLLDIENSCGATWGIACYGENYEYTRILTPYRDFSRGIDQAAPLWGITISTTRLSSSSEVTPNHFPVGKATLVGPINMEKLAYLPLSRQYKLADHFILIKREGDRFTIIDSEGVIRCYVDFDQLKKLLDIQGIPEAQNVLQIRIMDKTGEIESKKKIAEYTFHQAIKNLKDAECSEQGSCAFSSCIKIIRESSISNYRNSLNYNLIYLMQRRVMAVHFLDLLNEMKIIGSNHKLYRGFTTQIEQIALCRNALIEERTDVICYQLNQLAESEKEIIYQWEELSKNGWY